jgi:8-oxo-dGTP pyrophosphatase MutT (NUDIX family)
VSLLELTADGFEKVLTSALKMEFPYVDRAPRNLEPTPAAVLLLFGYHPDRRGPSLLYIRRTESVATHKGQMAFPGGLCEAQDEVLQMEGEGLNLCRFAVTALRETEEEVGISRSLVRVLGQMPTLITVTGYLIQPVVGVLKPYLNEISLILDADEIAEAIWIPLETLLHPDTYRRETIAVGDVRYPIDVFQVNHHRIWGATGSMTKNLLDRLLSLS